MSAAVTYCWRGYPLSTKLLYLEQVETRIGDGAENSLSIALTGRAGVVPNQWLAGSPSERQVWCLQYIVGCRIRKKERLEERNPRDIDAPTESCLSRDEGADMRVGRVTWDAQTDTSRFGLALKTVDEVFSASEGCGFGAEGKMTG